MVAVTDSASVMLKSTRDCISVDEHQRCIAHIINNAAETGFKNAIQSVVQKCKMLAACTHKSSKTCTLLRQVCQEVSVDYAKIIQPVKTRWNSMCLTMRSIVRLKPALLKIVSEGDRDSDVVRRLVKATPSESQFQVLEALVPKLEVIRSLSERLTADKRPSIHLVLMSLVTMNTLVTNNTAANNFLTHFKAYLNEKLPNCGRENELWCIGAFLHPRFKGSLLFYRPRPGSDPTDTLFNQTKSDIIARVEQLLPPPPPGTEERESQASVDPPSSQNLDRALSESQWTAVDEYLQSVELADFGTPEEEELPVNDIRHQIEVFLHKLPKPNEADGDILAFWKSNESVVPTLAKFARSILCIPASSASSERLFSAAGKLISEQRTNISASRAEQLIYISQNYDQAAPCIKAWDLGLPKKTKSAAGTPSASEPTPGTSAAALLDRDPEDEDEADEDWNYSDVDVDLPSTTPGSDEEEIDADPTAEERDI